MARSRASAKSAGATFERQIADCLALYVDDRIDRKVKSGAKDKGDIANLRTPGGSRIAVEAKNTARLTLGTFITEAEVERINDGALAGIVAHKRQGKGQPLDQYVTMTVRDFIAILTDKRPE